MYVHDPVFSSTETSFLTRLNLSVIPENEIGVRKVECSTLIFLPHCPTALVNNLLWCNWSPNLRNCIVFGNSFKSLAESQLEREFKMKYRYVHLILPSTTEFEVENTFQYSDVFNDLSLHVFLPHVLDKFDKSFWLERTRPEYDETEIECITEKLSKSKIES